MSDSKKSINITLPSSFLGFVFIVLKLSGQVTWDWTWVLAPFWLPWAMIIGVALTLALLVALGGAGAAAISLASYFTNKYRTNKFRR